VRYRPSRRVATNNSQGQANRAACFVELTFSEPVSEPMPVPMSLGQLSHFGLGLFKPLT